METRLYIIINDKLNSSHFVKFVANSKSQVEILNEPKLNYSCLIEKLSLPASR